MKKLTKEEKHENEAEIDIEELEDSLKHSNGEKTPGVDGIENNFLTCYWELIKATIHQATDRESINFYLETWLVKIIPKAGKDLEEIGDWRPILSHKFINSSVEI